MFDHGVILGIVAGGENDAFVRMGKDIFTGLGITQIGADAASVFHKKLLGKETVALLHVPGGNCRLHVFIHVHALIRQKFHRGRIARECLLAPVVVLRQGQKNGDQEVSRVLIGDGRAGLFGVI